MWENIAYLVSIYIKSIIVKSRVSDESCPLVPSIRDSIAVVFVQIFAKIT
jgi:hypothetical protein